jgi:hypothetical protein
MEPGGNSRIDWKWLGGGEGGRGGGVVMVAVSNMFFLF